MREHPTLPDKLGRASRGRGHTPGRGHSRAQRSEAGLAPQRIRPHAAHTASAAPEGDAPARTVPAPTPPVTVGRDTPDTHPTQHPTPRLRYGPPHPPPSAPPKYAHPDSPPEQRAPPAERTHPVPPTPTPTAPHDTAPPPFEPARCLGCHHRPATAGYLCSRCERRIPELLNTIRDGYPRLDPTPHGSGAGTDTAPHTRAPFGSRPAARVDVLALTTPPAGLRGHLPPADTDERAVAPPPAPPGEAPDTSCCAQGRPDLPAVVVVLGRVADRCRVDGLLPPLRGPRTVYGEALRLSSPDLQAELPYRWWVGEVLDELRAVADAVRRALCEVEPSMPLGVCPRPVLPPRILDAAGAPAPRTATACGAQVRSRDAGTAAWCVGCGHRWFGSVSVHALAGRAGQAMLDLPALATYLDGLGYGPDTPAARLRKWAQLDGWARERVGRRTVYRLADALDSARRYRRAPAELVAS